MEEKDQSDTSEGWGHWHPLTAQLTVEARLCSQDSSRSGQLNLFHASGTKLTDACKEPGYMKKLSSKLINDAHQPAFPFNDTQSGKKKPETLFERAPGLDRS